MRQISGEVYAAAQASTCCDVTGEESPNKARMGLPAKCMHFVGSPGWRGSQHITRGTRSLFVASLNTLKSIF